MLYGDTLSALKDLLKSLLQRNLTPHGLQDMFAVGAACSPHFLCDTSPPVPVPSVLGTACRGWLCSAELLLSFLTRFPTAFRALDQV